MALLLWSKALTRLNSSLFDMSGATQQASDGAASLRSNVDASSLSLTKMSASAQETTVGLRTVSSGIRETAIMGSQLTTLASDFGLIDSQTSKVYSHGPLDG